MRSGARRRAVSVIPATNHAAAIVTHGALQPVYLAAIVGAVGSAGLLAATDAAEALKLHHEFTAVGEKLSQAEERWLALQEEVAASE